MAYNIFITDEFLEKTKENKNDKAFDAIKFIYLQETDKLVDNPNVNKVDNNMYVLKFKKYRLFFTIKKNNVLFLDYMKK